MNRKEMKKYLRGLADEFTEYPQGMIRDESDEIDLDTLINVAIQNVQMDLIPHIPQYFRKTFLISVQANIREYDIVDDFGVEDYMIMENIYHNQTGQKPQGLLYAEPDQLHELGIIVGEKGDPKVWSYEGGNFLAFDPTPSSGMVNRYKGFYFRELPDLNQDEDHDPPNGNYAIPDLPKAARILVPLDVVKQWQIIGGDDSTKIDKRYAFYFNKATENALSIKPSFSLRDRAKLGESIR